MKRYILGYLSGLFIGIINRYKQLKIAFIKLYRYYFSNFIIKIYVIYFGLITRKVWIMKLDAESRTRCFNEKMNLFHALGYTKSVCMIRQSKSHSIFS